METTVSESCRMGGDLLFGNTNPIRDTARSIDADLLTQAWRRQHAKRDWLPQGYASRLVPQWTYHSAAMILNADIYPDDAENFYYVQVIVHNLSITIYYCLDHQSFVLSFGIILRISQIVIDYE